MGPTCNVVYILKTNFSFESCCQWRIISSLGKGVPFFFFIPVLGLCLTWTCTGLVYTATAAVSSYVCLSVVSGRCYFLGVIHFFCLLKVFLSVFLHCSLSSIRRDLIKTCHWGLSALKSRAAYCPFVGLCIVTHLLKKEPSLMMDETLICG